jgi:hypothetical protein
MDVIKEYIIKYVNLNFFIQVKINDGADRYGVVFTVRKYRKGDLFKIFVRCVFSFPKTLNFLSIFIL